jgi:glycosyltransferase involved in cell wall biosynthesis
MTMKALVLLPYPKGRVPGQRYRFEQWQPYLEAAGVQCDVRELLSAEELAVLHYSRSLWAKTAAVARSIGRALAAVPDSSGYDIVWIYRTLLLGGPGWIEALIALRRTAIVYEFDDAIWLTKTFDANQALAALKFSGKTAALCRLATAVIVGNETLAEYAHRFNDDVTVVPSTVDVDRYTPATGKTGDGRLVLGFSGSPTTIEYLAFIGTAIQRAAREVPLELRVMGAPFELRGVDVTLTTWSPAVERDELQRYDVGLMPLTDDAWTRGKGAMKALLYMSVGVPVVASPVGITSDIITDGVNGRLCRSEDDWVHAILTLARDAALRRRLGAAGRQTVMERFSPAVQVPRLVDALRRAAARR